jgi:hypothetical protein
MGQRVFAPLAFMLFIAAAVPLSAQHAGMEGKGPGGMMSSQGCPMVGMMQEGGIGPMQIEGRLASLMAELGVTDAQRAAWTVYAAMLRKNLEDMQSMHAGMRKAMEAGNPVDRLMAHIAAMEGRLDALREMKPALEQFYAALTSDQKAKADQLLTGMGCMM